MSVTFPAFSLSARDFEVYQKVHVEGASTRQAAAAMQISQTRVCQILRSVAEYLTATVPSEDKEKTLERLCVARYVASARVDHLYSKAVRAFDSSSGEAKTMRVAEGGLRGGSQITTIKQAYGDWRYLMAAARLAVISSRLPHAELRDMAELGPLENLVDEEEADWENDAVVADNEIVPVRASSRRASQPSTHPIRDCSPAAVEQPQTTAARAKRSRVSLGQDASCSLPSEMAACLQKMNSSPVQLLETEEQPGEEEVAFEVAPRAQTPRSRRKERKTRQAELRRKLQRA